MLEGRVEVTPDSGAVRGAGERADRVLEGYASTPSSCRVSASRAAKYAPR
jgi:hypothetical protein